MVGLALEGGGAKGSYQAGAYLALKKCHVKIDAVAGTSIGSFNGALIASHEEDKMVSLWKDTTMNSLLGIDEKKAIEIAKGHLSIENIKWTFEELHKIFKNKGLDMSNYRAMVRNNVDEEKLRKSDIKFGLTTVKLDTLEPLEVYLADIPKGKVCDYIVASSYLPVFKKEKLVDDSYYLDGGFYNLSPTDMLEKMGCDKIYVINIKGIGFRKKNKPKAEIIEIKPRGNLGSIIVFDKKSIEDNMILGYNDTMKLFGKIDGINYYFYKKSNWYYRRLNHRVNKKLMNAVRAVLNPKDYKELVLKALEYFLEEGHYKETDVYNIKDVIKVVKTRDTNNIVYRYIKKLNIW